MVIGEGIGPVQPSDQSGAQRLAITEEQRRAVESDVAAELAAVGVSAEHIARVNPIEYHGVLLPRDIQYRIQLGSVEVEGDIRYELQYGEGDQERNRQWDARLWIFPKRAVDMSIGADLTIPDFVQNHGYVAFIKRPTPEQTDPLMRVDSVCMPAMIDNGHHSSAGHEGFGCDCYQQRETAKAMIHESGGISILTPFEGRGNGDNVHATQIQLQNWALRHGVQPPGTYEAHEMAGVKGDGRRKTYWLDSHAFVLVGSQFEKITLLTNNPDKASAFGLAAEGIGVELGVRDLHADSAQGYYGGQNFLDKIQQGGHTNGNGHV